MNKFFVTLATLAVVALAMPSGVADCVRTDSSPEFDSDRDAPGVYDATVGAPHRQFYVDNDLCQTDLENQCGFSIWIYEESNGRAGLQRADDFYADELCGGAGDTIVF